MPFQILTLKERLAAAAFALTMGVTLMLGFLPMVNRFYGIVGPALPLPEPWTSYGERLFFPLVAAFFGWSLKYRETSQKPTSRLLAISLLPVALAWLFGVWNPHPEFWAHPQIAFWYLVCIPIGEEFLFRQWFYRLTYRLWGNRFFTFTNPFPTPVFLSAVAFSLWHFQNWTDDAIGLVLFQVVYTFFTGLWLGTLRHETGRLWPSILAHFLINLASSIPLPAMLK